MHYVTNVLNRVVKGYERLNTQFFNHIGSFIEGIINDCIKSHENFE